MTTQLYPPKEKNLGTIPSETTPRSFRRLVCLLSAAIVLTAVAGGVHGQLTRRWQRSFVLEEAGQRLQGFPKAFGKWQMSDSTELSDKVEGTLMCRGYINRRYVHQETGEAVNIAVLVGPPGPMSVHTPEICFSSKQFELNEKRQEISVPERTDPEESFWSLRFRSRDLSARGLQVYYAWNYGEGWRVSENPRFGFAMAPYLYKLQMAVDVRSSGADQEEGVGLGFLQEFLPALEPFLMSRETQSGHKL